MPGYTQRMREILQDPVMQEAIMSLRDSNEPRELELEDADAVASVRRHSRGVGFNNALGILVALANPLPRQDPELEPTYEAP